MANITTKVAILIFLGVINMCYVILGVAKKITWTAIMIKNNNKWNQTCVCKNCEIKHPFTLINGKQYLKEQPDAFTIKYNNKIFTAIPFQIFT